jgi:uncharacterized C2H2 Zn-finger protein
MGLLGKRETVAALLKENGIDVSGVSLKLRKLKNDSGTVILTCPEADICFVEKKVYDMALTKAQLLLLKVLYTDDGKPVAVFTEGEAEEKAVV